MNQYPHWWKDSVLYWMKWVVFPIKSRFIFLFFHKSWKMTFDAPCDKNMTNRMPRHVTIHYCMQFVSPFDVEMQYIFSIIAFFFVIYNAQLNLRLLRVEKWPCLRAMACSDGGLSKSDSSLSLPLAMETSLLSTCSHKFRYCSCMQTRISNSKLLRPSSDGMFPNVNTLRSHVVLPRRQVEKNMVSFWMSWLVYQQTKEAGTSHDVGMYLGKKKTIEI